MTIWGATFQETHIRASFSSPHRVRWRGPGVAWAPTQLLGSTTENVMGGPARHARSRVPAAGS